MKNENVHWALTSHRHVKTRLTHPYFRKWQHFSTRRSTALAAAGAAAGLVLQETMIAHYNKLLNRLITGFGMGCAELLHPEKVKRQKQPFLRHTFSERCDFSRDTDRLSSAPDTSPSFFFSPLLSFSFPSCMERRNACLTYHLEIKILIYYLLKKAN